MLTALADLLVCVHLGYVLFVIVGLALVWVGRWRGRDWVHRPGFRLTHLACTLIVPIEALSGVVCPLTVWERQLRQRAGQFPEDISFVGRLVRDVLFYRAPEQVFTVCYVVFGLFVLATLFLVPVSLRRVPREAAG